MASQHIQAVVFDVNETMIDMSPLQSRMQAKGLPKDAFQAPCRPSCMHAAAVVTTIELPAAG